MRKPSLNNVKMRYKLLLLIFGTVFIVMSLMVYINFRMSETIIRRETVESAYLTIHQINMNFDFKVKSYHRLINLIYGSRDLQRLFTQTYPDRFEWFEARREIREILILMTNLGVEEHPSATFYLNNPTIPSEHSGFIQYMALSSITQEPWYMQVLESDGRGQFWGDTHDALFLCKLLKDTTANQAFGLVKLEIPKYLFFNLVSNIKDGGEHYTVVFNEQGTMLYSSNRAWRSQAPETLHALWVLTLDGEQSGSIDTQLENRPRLAVYDRQNRLNWTTMILYPRDEIIRQTLLIRRYMMLISAAALIVLLILVYVITGITTRRLSRLSAAMGKVGAGDFQYRLDIAGQDEVGEMAAVFRQMVQEIQDLIDENVRKEKEQHRLELQALQEQINPHFLYNTLSAIRSLAIDIDAHDIDQVAYALSAYYRLTLSKGESIIPLQDEIEMVRNYIFLLNRKCKDRLIVEYAIEPELLNHPMPKLTLQPFVENAVLHGLNQCAEGEGVIRITASRDSGFVTITIQDNGKGIPSATLNRILNDKTDGYGIWNVNQRLKLIYGEEYGVSLESRLGEGTSVIIRMR